MLGLSGVVARVFVVSPARSMLGRESARCTRNAIFPMGDRRGVVYNRVFPVAVFACVCARVYVLVFLRIERCSLASHDHPCFSWYVR